MTTHEAAVRYARNGWPIFPLWPIVGGKCSCGKCDKPGKHPHVSGWQQHPCDLASVEGWWTQWPDAGIAMKLDYNIVLDLDMHDTDKNGFESLEALQQDHADVLEDRVKARTGGGGEHQLYQGMEGIETSIGFANGLDLLSGPGRFICVEPSEHVSGRQYRWLDTVNPLTTPRSELTLGVLPQWLLDSAKGPTKPTTRKPAQPATNRRLPEYFVKLALAKIAGGEIRNNAGMWFFCQLRDEKYDRDEAFLELHGWVERVNEAAPKSHRYTFEEAKATWRSVYKRDARDPMAGDEEDKPSQTDELLSLTTDFEFYRSGPADDAYVRLVVGGHLEVHQAGNAKGPSAKLRQILTQRFLEKHNRAPNRESLNQAGDTIVAKCGAGPKVDTHVRFARSNEAIFLDLCDDQWRAVEITANGWQVVANPPVLFRRGAGAKPLPEPVKGGSLDALRGLINTGDDENWCLMLAWLVGCFLPTGAFPLLLVEGEMGSAKSTACLLLLALVDPSTGGLCGQPKDEVDATVSALHSGVLAYDNLKTLRADMSNVFCRFSTGQGYRTRTFYENLGLTVVEVRLPLLINGIDSTVMQGDLLNRSIKLWLPAIAAADRTTIAKVEREFEVLRPGVLGALLDAVSTGLANLPNTVVADAPRMSDFCTFVVACEPALPWQPGEFLNAYRGKQADAVANIVDLDDVGSALLKWADENLTPGSSAVVYPGVLLRWLNDVTVDVPKDLYHWPHNPQEMAYRLPGLAPMLRDRGIHILKLKRDKNGVRYEIRRDGPQPKLALLFAEDARKVA